MGYDATNGALETRPFGIYTFDAGRKWKVLFVWSGRVFRALAFNTQTLGTAVGDSGVIFQSTNAGQRWDSTSSPTKGNPFVQSRKLMLLTIAGCLLTFRAPARKVGLPQGPLAQYAIVNVAEG